jgi:hypothetical protein
MSLELDVRLWWDGSDLSTSERFEKTLGAFESWRGGQVEWTSAVLRKAVPGNKIKSLEGPLTTAQVLGLFPEDTTEDYYITAYSYMPCWRFSKEGISDEFVPIALSGWGNNYGTGFNFDRRFEGQAQFSVLNSGPFFGVMDRESQDFLPTEQNAKVEENLERLMEVLQTITLHAEPTVWMAFSDEGSSYLPLNAHAAWFENPAKLLQVVQAFKADLSAVNASQRLQPIESLDELRGTGYGHSFRAGAAEAQILKRLQKIATSPKAAHAMALDEVLNKGKYDFYEFEEGLILLDFPFFLNSFLDEFVLDLLEQA